MRLDVDATYRGAMAVLLAGDSLDEAGAGAVASALLDESLGAPRAAALLTALAGHTPTSDELVGMAKTLRARAIRVPFDGPVFDSCGTGGSGLSTANTSTTVAFVVAAAGVVVAKHGNRASTGQCGSSDLLEALGVPVVIGPSDAARLLERVGVAFLFAPAYHPALAVVGPVRKALGFRTVFNLLGPLCNPAGARRQLLGLSDPRALEIVANALGRLGVDDAMVVSGEDGLDEVSLAARTRGVRVGRDGASVSLEIEPTDAGVESAACEALVGGGPSENAAIFERVLGGDDGPHARLVALNAGAALMVAGIASNLREGTGRARDLLRSGAARQTFSRFREESRALARAA